MPQRALAGAVERGVALHAKGRRACDRRGAMMELLPLEEIFALVELVRQALEMPGLRQEDVPQSAGVWNSHETLHILFGAEEICAVQFSSTQMENVDGFETLVKAIADARGKA